MHAWVLAAVLAAGLDPVEVAVRHERAGRPHLALHLLDHLTSGAGDAKAQAVRSRLKDRIGQGAASPAPTASPASATPAPSPRPAASASPALTADPLPLFKAKKYKEAAPLFRKRLEASSNDYTSFSYLVLCYFHQAQQLLDAGDEPGARAVFREGLRTEQMYLPSFPEQAGSQAPDHLLKQLGP
jgi:hypothetical protein